MFSSEMICPNFTPLLRRVMDFTFSFMRFISCFELPGQVRAVPLYPGANLLHPHTVNAATAFVLFYLFVSAPKIIRTAYLLH